ncbi:hypothetical protein [Micromonospora sp. NBC_00617]|uniref:hypothetical protein n=1 Tax=Micromonospora sp. NBC_00617 TaxID=2903587 RepID=UPI0030DE16CE
MTPLNPGDLLVIGPACSVQFTGDRILRVRLVSIGVVDPYHDWLWLTGYVLDVKGNAIAKRELYVQRAGIVVEQRRPPLAPRSSARTTPAQPRARTARVRAS